VIHDSLLEAGGPIQHYDGAIVEFAELPRGAKGT